MGYKEDLQRVHSKIDGQKQELLDAIAATKPAAAAGRWNIANALFAGAALLLAGWVAYASHSSSDLHDKIKIEVTEQLKEPLKQLAEMSGDIKAIETVLGLNGIQAFVSVPKNELPATLPQLKKNLDVVKQEKLPLSHETVREVQQRLLQVDQDSPDYWPTVVTFLQVASARLAPANVPPSTEAPKFISSRDQNTVIAGLEYDNMVVLLQGGVVTDARFVNCRIIFTDTPVRIMNTQFINSVFEFRVPTSKSPSPYIKQASKILLASNLSSVSISN